MESVVPAEPPCHRCVARCCRQQTSGWPFAAALEPKEYSQFAATAVYDPHTQAYVLPYDAQGDCPHLSADNRCQAHHYRPQTCRDFDCRTGHIIFVSRNPELLDLLETAPPDSDPRTQSVSDGLGS